MRRAVAIAIAASALLLVGAVTPAGALARDPPVRLTIVTLPKLVGIRFALDGRTFVTGRSGYARIQTTPGTHLLQALDTSVRRPSTRSTFLRWSDGRFTGTRTITIAGDTRLDVGYRQSVRVSFRFIDPAGHPVVGRVTRLTLSNTLGGQPSFQPEWPQWLPAISITRRFSGLGQTLVKYSIKQALVGGSNVVNHAQQRFYPALDPTGHRATPPVLGPRKRSRLPSGDIGRKPAEACLPQRDSLRRIHCTGRSCASRRCHAGPTRSMFGAAVTCRPSASRLSRNQVLKVRVISYLDMFLFLVMALAAVAVLRPCRSTLSPASAPLPRNRAATDPGRSRACQAADRRAQRVDRPVHGAGPRAAQRARGGQRLPVRSAARDRSPAGRGSCGTAATDAPATDLLLPVSTGSAASRIHAAGSCDRFG